MSKILSDEYLTAASTTNQGPAGLQLTNPANSKREESEIRFIRTQNYCVCCVDIIGSTRTASNLGSSERVRRYYGIFLNTMAAIARGLGAKVVKTVGDCLIFFFPRTSDPSNKSAFDEVFECCITMMDAHSPINEKLHEEGLPSLSYRISADYGRVEIARSATSQSDDLFGPIMDICSKINSNALPNGAVIGDGLYQVIQSFSVLPSLENNYYRFDKMVMLEHQQTEFNSYPLYYLQKSNYNATSDSLDIQEQLEPSINILLVDDEEDILYTFKAELASEGYNVKTFVEPMEALIHFTKVTPSYYKLAILDIRMPGLNGLQLYYRLKAINRNIKILFVSALDAVPELVSILPDVRASNDIIKKPVALDNFINSVKSKIFSYPS